MEPEKEIQKCTRIYLSEISEWRNFVKDEQQTGQKIYNSVSKGNQKSNLSPEWLFLIWTSSMPTFTYQD